MSLLEITNLKKAYNSPDGKTLDISDIPSFTLNEGKQLALHEASESGKTTFLDLIAGILKRDAGIDLCVYPSPGQTHRSLLN